MRWTLSVGLCRGARPVLGAAAAALLLAASVSAAPQSAPPAQAVDPAVERAVLPGATAPGPRLTAPAISLAEAVQLTLGNSPQIKLGQQDVGSRRGSLQRERGAFDWSLFVSPALTYTNAALAPSVRQDEVNKRLKFQIVATSFGSINRQLLDQINSLGPRPPRCPIEFVSPAQIGQFNMDPLSFRFTGIRGFENTYFTFTGGLRSTIQSFKNSSVCASLGDNGVSLSGSLYATLDNANDREFGSIFQRMFSLATGQQSIVQQLNRSGLQEAVVTLVQAPHEILGVSQQIAEAAAAQAVLALDRLGVVPADEVVTTSTLDASVSRLFRGGVSAGFTMHFQSTADNFKDKSLDPTFGGLGRPIFFRSQAVGTVTIPLGRGRGIGTTAFERAAQLSLSAETDRLRHTAAEEAFRTTLAYLSLVGAQETVRSLEESLARQNQIGQLTGQRIAAGDLAAVERARVQARTAAVAASLSQARRAVVDARVSLAEAMGVDVETLANAPLAAETFATTLRPVPEVDALMTAATASRLDARALASLSSAARLLEEGALANARPRFDLLLKGGMGSFYDDLTFYYLPDEVNPIFTLLPQDAPPQPATGAVRFSSPVGFGRAMFERTWRPIWAINLAFDLPFRNNTLRGRAAQAEASRQRAEVQERDLLRVIRENVVNEAGSLRQQAEAIGRAEAAVQASQQTVDAAVQRFQMGDQTLIDTLLAEESLTQDRLSLVQLWQAYLSELARLRFETGTLVSFTGPAIAPDQVRFDPTEFVAR